MLLLRRVAHAWFSLYIICFSRDGVCSLLILYSFSHPHAIIITFCCVRSNLLALLIVSTHRHHHQNQMPFERQNRRQPLISSFFLSVSYLKIVYNPLSF